MPVARAVRLAGARGDAVTITFDGEPVRAYRGETVATALLAHGVAAFIRTRTGDARGPLCNMGSCFECAVTVDGRPLVRACLTYVVAGLTVTSTRAC